MPGVSGQSPGQHTNVEPSALKHCEREIEKLDYECTAVDVQKATARNSNGL